jgi:excisionase family DNA binding protein
LSNTRFSSRDQGERLAYSFREVAEALGVSESHVSRLAKAGAIPTVVVGKRKLVPREEFEAFLRGQRSWEAQP